MTHAGNLKPTLVNLGDRDRICIERIKDRLELDSSALAIRVAIRDLAKRLDTGQELQGTQAKDRQNPGGQGG